MGAVVHFCGSHGVQELIVGTIQRLVQKHSPKHDDTIGIEFFEWLCFHVAFKRGLVFSQLQVKYGELVVVMNREPHGFQVLQYLGPILRIQSSERRFNHFIVGLHSFTHYISETTADSKINLNRST